MKANFNAVAKQTYKNDGKNIFIGNRKYNSATQTKNKNLKMNYARKVHFYSRQEKSIFGFMMSLKS